MSRTKHRSEDRKRRTSPRSTLTKGKRSGEYSPSTLDAPANKGRSGSWKLWLNSYNGYQKARKRRKRRQVMKTYGRRVERRRRNRGDCD